ncbi:MAG TPA: pseudouridine synthase, partial [Longimicrobiales bacterium]|nr:pseudouridine synthase [Longimicrobiales bacterium]
MAEGRVRVNGEVVTELGARIDPDEDAITVDGRPVTRPPLRWILLHKPRGHVTTKSDPHGRATVYDLLPERFRGLRYVGRLDMDTEGLLLFTNEGDAGHRRLHPSWEVEREYRATVEGRPDRDALRRLEEGVELEDGPARAVEARLVEEAGHGAVLALVLREGRKREVRRMCEAVGHPVTHLARVRFGPVALGDLPPGEWRELSDGEIRTLRERVELAEDDDADDQ